MLRIRLGLAGAMALAAARGAAAGACPGDLANPSASATWYSEVAVNACSLPVAPGELVAAAAAAEFDGSALCGRCLSVSGPEGSVGVRVTDLCPSCAAGNLDLGYDAFARIADPLTGVVPIAWHSVPCDVVGPLRFFFGPGSNPYFAIAQVRNHRMGVAELAVASGSTWVALPRRGDNYFTLDASVLPVPLAAPFDLRVTSVDGQTLETAGVPYTLGAELDGAGNFAACPEPGPPGAAVAAIAGLAGAHAGSRRRDRPGA